MGYEIENIHRLMVAGEESFTQTSEEILSKPIRRKGVLNYVPVLWLRTVNTLENAGIATLGVVVEYTGHDLLRFRGFGRKCLCYLEAELARYGLRLKQS